MCLTINLFSEILDEFKKEPKPDPNPPQAFYKCGRSGKTNVYCPILTGEKNGVTTLRSTRQKK